MGSILSDGDGCLDRNQVETVFGDGECRIVQLIRHDGGPPLLYTVAETEGQTVTLIATDKSKKTVTQQEFVAMYRNVDVKQDIVTKSLDALAIETIESITIDHIACQAKNRRNRGTCEFSQTTFISVEKPRVFLLLSLSARAEQK